MQPSIIQLKQIRYVGVKVWPQPFEQLDGQNIASFDFNGVEIGELSETYALTEENEPLSYGVMLRVAIENKGGKIAPYDIDVCVIGHFEISERVPKEKRKNLVTVNGCSMLYGAIREQVMILSARSVHGMLILPTTNFQDKIEENTELPQNDKSIRAKRTTKKKKTN